MTSPVPSREELVGTVTRYRHASIVLLLTLGAQIALTYLSSSVVVFGDTAHLAGDSLGQCGTWIVLALMLRMYIDHSTTTLFVTLNILLLLVGGVWTGYESIMRFSSPVQVDQIYALGAGVVGLFGNFCAVNFLKGPQTFPTKLLGENHRVNLVHLRSDVWLSVAVIVSAIGSALFGVRVDPALGILVSLYILNEATGHAYYVGTGKHYPFHLHKHAGHSHHH